MDDFAVPRTDGTGCQGGTETTNIAASRIGSEEFRWAGGKGKGKGRKILGKIQFIEGKQSDQSDQSQGNLVKS